MKNRGGRKQTPELSILQCMIWAHALVAANGGEPRKLVFLYPSTRTGKDSTLFFKMLEHGRPLPKLFLDDGSQGPALRAEQDFPGTLQWLLHPLWTTLEMVDFPFLRTVYQSILSLASNLSSPLLETRKGEWVRINLPLDKQLRQLKDEGSLDALACVILLAQEAYCLCKPSNHVQILDFASRELIRWQSISWMPQALKIALVQCALAKIHRCTPVPLDADSANMEALQSSILSNGLLAQHMTIEQFRSVTALVSATPSASCFSESSSFDLTAQAHKTLQTRIAQWIASGVP